MKVLAERTGTPMRRVTETTLSAYEGLIYEKHNPYGNTAWIMPVGVYHRTRRRFGLQFCPRCLSDKVPYFRRSWRLAFVTLCVKHRVALLDRCMSCGEAINFHRDEMGDRNKQVSDSMTLCHSCKFDIRDAPVESIDQRTGEVEFQEHLLKAMNRGWVEIPGHGAVYSHLYFIVLHQLVRLLATGKRAPALRIAAEQRYWLTQRPFLSKERDFERLDVAHRRWLLNAAGRLLGEWPDGFIDFCTTNQVWSSLLFRDLDAVPYWYWKVVRATLYRVPYYPSQDEIMRARVYFSTRGSRMSKKSAIIYLRGSALPDN